MKKVILAGIALSLSFSAAQAQLFNPDSVSGALLGGVIGGVIGNNSGHGHHGGEGAAIGAASGFLLGNLAYHSRRSYYDGYYGGGYYGGSYSYPSYGYYGYRPYPYYRSYYGWRGGWGRSIYYQPDYYYWAAPTYNATAAPAPVVVQAQPAQQPQPQAQQPTTVINNYYYNSTPMGSANSLFGRLNLHFRLNPSKQSAL